MTGRVFNDYDFGGFLVYNGIPTFIDGRSELFGDAFMKAYLEAAGRSTPESLRALLDSYQIEWTLLKPSREGVSVLDKLPEWRRVYSDEFAVAHVRHLPSAAAPDQPAPPHRSVRVMRRIEARLSSPP